MLRLTNKLHLFGLTYENTLPKLITRKDTIQTK